MRVVRNEKLFENLQLLINFSTPSTGNTLDIDFNEVMLIIVIYATSKKCYKFNFLNVSYGLQLEPKTSRMITSRMNQIAFLDCENYFVDLFYFVYPFLVPPVGPVSTNVTCPACRAQIRTEVRHETTGRTHLWALCLCLCL